MVRSLVVVTLSVMPHVPPEPLKVKFQKGLVFTVMVLPPVVEVKVTVELAELNVPPVASQVLEA